MPAAAQRINGSICSATKGRHSRGIFKVVPPRKYRATSSIAAKPQRSGSPTGIFRSDSEEGGTGPLGKRRRAVRSFSSPLNEATCTPNFAGYCLTIPIKDK